MFLCIAMAFLVFAKRYGRTFVWNPDGYMQHYTVISYMGQMLRNLFSGDGFEMVSFSLGQGMDVLTTCSYYGLTDPLSLLAVFGQENSVEYVYMFIDFLRVYLVGLAFGIYARTLEIREDWAIAYSGIIYVFSGYFIYMIGRHPYFLNGALYLTLMLTAIERVLRDRKWLMYVLVSALMLVVNFYFAFMNTIMAIIYIIVRLISRMKERGIRESAKDGFILLGGYLLGIGISAIVFLPVVLAFLRNSRMDIEAGYMASKISYGLKYYWDAIMYMFAPANVPGDFLLLNYTPLALFGLMSLWCVGGSKARQIRIGLYLCLAVMILPEAGRILNGMAYVSQRWSYAMALFIATGCLVGLPALLEEKKKSRNNAIAVLAMIYGALILWNTVRKRDWPQLAAAVCICSAAFMLLLRYRKWFTGKRIRALMAVFLVFTSVAYSAICYLPRGYGYIFDQQKAGVYEQASSQAAGHLIEDEGVYRVGQADYVDPHSLMLDYMGTSFWWSLVDGKSSEYYRALALPSQRNINNVHNLGASVALNSVAAVKYYIRHEGSGKIVPYGFEKKDLINLPDGNRAEVYENKYALPLGYAFDRVMPETEYEKLSAIEKYQALMDYAVCDLAEEKTDFKDKSAELDYVISEVAGVEMSECSLKTERGGKIAIEFEAPSDSEVYLLIEGLELSRSDYMSEGWIVVNSDNGSIETNVPTKRSPFYFPKLNQVFCLGEGGEALNSCTINFDNAMNYDYTCIRLVSVPLDGYRQAAEARRAEPLREIELANNRIAGRISVDGERILQIAVPYSDGWSAWVDGRKAEIFRCGGMYMGIALAPGEHEIEMKYVTPGLKTGTMVSSASLLLLIALLCGGKKRKKGDYENENSCIVYRNSLL